MNEQKTFDSLLTDLELPYTVESIKEYPFEFVRSLCNVYDEDSGKKGITAGRLVDTKQLLNLLPSICRPKELLLALLEEANSFKTYEKFTALLSPINDCLLQIPNKRHQSVVLAFETLCAHIECERLPNFSTDCIETLDAVQFPVALEDNLNLFLSYFKTHVNDASSKVINAIKENEDISGLKSEPLSLSSILLKLFARPLAYKKCNFVHGNSEMVCLELFSELQQNGIKFIRDIKLWKSKNDAECEKLTNGKDDEKIEIVKSVDSDDAINKTEKITWDVETGLGTLAFSIFNEQYNGNLIPQLYTPTFLFLSHVDLIIHLLGLRNPNSHPADKGCLLTMYFLKRIGTCNLKNFSLDQKGVKSFVEKLIEISTTSNVKEVSQKCLACLNALIWCLQPTGRVELLNFILHSTRHSGLLGFIVTAIKNQVDESLKNGDDVFIGSALNRLAKIIFVVNLNKIDDMNKNSLNESEAGKKSEKINILDETDRIMSCLNFLRFLLLKQHQQVTNGRNLINLKNLLPVIQTNFITPLKSELVHLKADGLAELSYLDGDQQSSAPLTSITVGHETIDCLTKEDKLKMVQVVLTNIDLIESVLVRTETLICNPSDGSNVVHNPSCPWSHGEECSKATCGHRSPDSTNPNEISHLAMKLNSRISPL